MSIKARLPKAKAASKNVALTLHKSSKVAHYGQRSLANPSVNYQQKLEWIGIETIEDITFPVIRVSCHQVAGVGMPQPDCRGNSNSTICYHCLATLIKRASDNDYTLSLFDHFSDAARYANFGGKLIKIVSTQGDGYCWGVSKKRDSLRERVNLMRGEIERGID